MRVVSLLPSATEMLYAIGIEPVGVSHECDYPAAASELPAVNSSRIDPDASSTAIDEQVQEAIDSGGVYEIDRECLEALDPDVVVSQGICDVCAVDDSEIRRTIDDLGLDIEVVTSDPHSLEDVLADIERLGERLGRAKRASAVRAELERRIRSITAETPDDGPTVAVLDWLDPVMVAGHWIPEMVELVGGEYGLAGHGDRSRPREWAEIIEYDPELLIAAPCGFDLEQSKENVTDLTSRDGWNELTAVRNEQVYLMDGHHYVNRPGPRLVETLAALGAVIHPDSVSAPGDATTRFGAVSSPQQ